MEKMMAQKSKSVDGLTKGIEGLFKKNKVTYARGWGSLTGTPGEVLVTKDDGTTETVVAKNVVLATGSGPRLARRGGGRRDHRHEHRRAR